MQHQSKKKELIEIFINLVNIIYYIILFIKIIFSLIILIQKYFK